MIQQTTATLFEVLYCRCAQCLRSFSGYCVLVAISLSRTPAPGLTEPSACGTAMGATSTGATPCSFMPSCCAILGDKSTIRPSTYGPRSLISTTELLPFSRFVTLALVPKGRVLLAAILARGFIGVPSAMVFPTNPGP